MTVLARDKHIVVVGLGVTGLSCARYLSSRGISFSVMDSRENPPGLEELKAIDAHAPVYLGGFDDKRLREASEIWLSPGVPLAHPDIEAVKDSVVIRGDVDVFSQQVKAPVVAITGSNGKSTVTTLVGEMAMACGKKVAVGGNLGTPVLDLLADDIELYVVELSSFQLETTKTLGATAATILNVSQDHMDRYLSMAAYHLAKLRIFFGCQHLVLNSQEPLSQPPVEKGVDVTWFGLSEPDFSGFGIAEDAAGEKYLTRGTERLLPVSAMRIKGQHNWANALAAFALATSVGLDIETCIQTVKEFTGLPHRCEWVGQYQSVDFINDSKATNVGATLAALDGLGPVTKGNLILIAGGQGKGQDFSPLYAGVERWVTSTVLIGESRSALNEGMKSFIPTKLATSMKEAVEFASAMAKPGDTVLLSPACASFDMFSSYSDRGNQFRELANSLEVRPRSRS